MSTVYVGIDPGQNGGLAAITKQGVWQVNVMPIIGKGVNGRALWEWFIGLGHPGIKILATVEKVSAFPEQGVTGVFTFGVGYGIIQGVLQSMQIPYQLVTPQAWKKVILAGTPKDKIAAIEYCHRVYPYVDLLATPRSRVPHDGIADAICMAAYGAKTFK